jgi:hypothetical protein
VSVYVHVEACLGKVRVLNFFRLSSRIKSILYRKPLGSELLYCPIQAEKETVA